MDSSNILAIPRSDWYELYLECNHSVFTRVRLGYNAPRQVHYIRCPVGIHKVLDWQKLTKVEGRTNAEVSDVLDGTRFILPNRIMRIGESGNPQRVTGPVFPYTSREREY